MTGFIDRLLDVITPRRYRLQAERAEQDLEAAQRLNARVNRVSSGLREELIQNHFAERVRAAYARKGTR